MEVRILRHSTLVSNGVTGQQGTMIIPLLHSVLREEQHWDTPWSFNPQHFLDLNGNFKKNPAFLPFSAGNVNRNLELCVLSKYVFIYCKMCMYNVHVYKLFSG